MNQDSRRRKHLWKLSRLVSSQNAINLFNTFLGKFPQFYFCEELIQINFTIKQLNIYVLEAKILWGKIFFGHYQLVLPPIDRACRETLIND